FYGAPQTPSQRSSARSAPVEREYGRHHVNTLLNWPLTRQEPDDGRLSRPVPWKRRGEIPLRDPITPGSESV
uniref:hypothetical protein n=1 Tax=Xenorhabdus entomophaga TaxID=3136257 RepID=UPI0030F414E8